MGVNKADEFYLFGCLKRNKYEVLTILRKHKHKNSTISEFMKRIFNFQNFERNDILFLSLRDWMKRQEQLDSVRKCRTGKSGDASNSIQQTFEGITILMRI